MPRREEQLRKAIRRNRAMRIRDEWVDRLARALKTQSTMINLLTPEDTAILKRKFYEKAVAAGRRSKSIWPGQDRQAVLQHVSDMQKRIPDHPVILFSSVDPLIGAAVVALHCILRSVAEAWGVTEEDLCVGSDAMRDGLLLEYNLYGRASEYELVCWGEFRG